MIIPRLVTNYPRGCFSSTYRNTGGQRDPDRYFPDLPGPVMASFDRFAITVLGKGCHGSTPENGIDPINIAAHIILSLEGIVTREISGCTPAVISVGMIHGGSYENVIPDIVQIKGTIRSFDEEIRQKLARRLEEVSRCCAQTFGGDIAFELFRGIQPLINDAGMAAFAAGSAAKVVGSGKVLTQMKHPLMGSDNFSCDLEQPPARISSSVLRTRKKARISIITTAALRSTKMSSGKALLSLRRLQWILRKTISA